MPKYEVDYGGKKYEVDAPDPRTAWQYAEIYSNQNKPKEGFGAALGKGVAQLVSGARTGAGLFGDANQAALEGLERQKGIGERYADQTGLDLLKKAWNERGVTGAVGEVGRQIPLAIAEQLPRMGVSATGAVTGARLGAVASPFLGPLAPVAPVLGGALGAFAPNLLEMTGAFAERQAQTQQDQGQPIDVSTGKALAAAVPAAALDVAAQAIPLGRGLVAKLLGVPAQQLVKRSEAQVMKLAEERLAKTLAKGSAVGVATEGTTEAVQAMIERMQAGLPLTSDDAMKEYAENAYGGALLGVLGGAGRFSDRSGAKTEVAEKQQQQRVAERAQADQVKQAEQEAAKGPALSPEEALTKRTALTKQVDILQSQVATAASAGDAAAVAKLNPQLQEASKALAEIPAPTSEATADGNPDEIVSEPTLRVKTPAIEAKLAKLRKELIKAGDLGEFDKITKLIPKITALEEQLGATKPTPEVTPEAVPEAVPEAAAPTEPLAPEVSPEAAPEAVSEAVPEAAAPEAVPEAAAPEAVPEAVPEAAAPEAVPEAAAPTEPLAPEAAAPEAMPEAAAPTETLAAETPTLPTQASPLGWIAPTAPVTPEAAAPEAPAPTQQPAPEAEDKVVFLEHKGDTYEVPVAPAVVTSGPNIGQPIPGKWKPMRPLPPSLAEKLNEALAKEGDAAVKVATAPKEATEATEAKSKKAKEDERYYFRMVKKATESKRGGVDLAQAQARIDALNLPDGVSVDYFPTREQLPSEIVSYMAAQGAPIESTKGGVLPSKPGTDGAASDARVFIIGENHTDMVDLEKTVAHELIGHVGFDAFVGEKGMEALLDKTSNISALADRLNISREGMEGLAGRDLDRQLLKEVVAYTEQARVDASMMQKAGTFIKEMLGALRAALKRIGFVDTAKMSTSDLLYVMRQSRAAYNSGTAVSQPKADGAVSFRIGERAKYAGDVPEILTRKDSSLIGKKQSATERIRANLLGLNATVQFIDRAAAHEEIAKRGLAKGLIDSVKAMDLTYFMRAYDLRNSFVSEVATVGPLALTKDSTGATMVQAKAGANLKQLAEALAKANVGNSEATDTLFKKYLIAERALGVDGVGIDKVSYDEAYDPAELQAALKFGRENDAFQEARKIYKEYNKGLIDFAVKTGYISKEDAAGYLKGDYVSYYRVNDKGIVNLYVGGEKPIRIGNIKTQPNLKELVGGKDPMQGFFDGALQNTALLTSAALNNLAARNVAFTLADLGIARRVKDKVTGTDIIRAKIDGKDQAWRIDTAAKEDLFGDIPSELVVKAMEGISTTLPAALRVLGVPTNILRKFVTRDPRYALRSIVRESLMGAFTSGANYKPVISTLGEISKMAQGKSETYTTLQSRGIVGGQVISGMPDDMQKILLQITGGKPGWDYAMAKFDSMAMAGDAATRVNMYNSFIEQGLGEREATMATLESMNFTKRGLSPSMQAMHMLIPFFNAQITGLNVLYKVLAGKAPEQEKLRVKQKFIARGLMMAGMTLAYTALMGDDDEAYENATPAQRLGNWFVRLPGLDEPVRVPIPFEVGLLFKAIPEALMHMAGDDPKSEQAVKGLTSLAKNSIPGYSSYFLPQAIKPAIEVALNKSIFNGAPIVSGKLERLLPAQQFDERSTGFAKLFGEVLNVSPKQVDHLINGYFGTLGTSLFRLADLASGGTAVPQPTARVSDYPVLGGLFQPKDASGVVQLAFEEAQANEQAMGTFKKLAESDPEKARAFLQQYAGQIAASSAAGVLRQTVGEINAAETLIRANSDLSPEQKREYLDRLRQLEILVARQSVAQSKQIKLQVSR